MSKSPGHKASRKQEEDVAADNGGYPTPGSGNTWRRRNDVISPEFSFECKTTTRASYSLKRRELDIAEQNALMDGRDMVFVTDISGRRYYTVCDYTWQTLRGG